MTGVFKGWLPIDLTSEAACHLKEGRSVQQKEISSQGIMIQQLMREEGLDNITWAVIMSSEGWPPSDTTENEADIDERGQHDLQQRAMHRNICVPSVNELKEATEMLMRQGRESPTSTKGSLKPTHKWANLLRCYLMSQGLWAWLYLLWQGWRSMNSKDMHDDQQELHHINVMQTRAKER